MLRDERYFSLKLTKSFSKCILWRRRAKWVLVISRAQIRAARALVGWSQADLAQASGVSQVAIKNLERGATDPRMSTISSIQAAFDHAGVMFLDAGDVRDGGAGVRFRERQRS
jgi:DNA-binding XRE family transcriptional regulator